MAAFLAALPGLISAGTAAVPAIKSMFGGGQLTDAQKNEIYAKMNQAAPDKSAYDTSGLAGYEDYFSKAGDTTDPRMAEVLNLAGAKARGEGPSVAQKQSDLAVANAAANARSLAAGARGGGLGAYQALKAGSMAAGQAAGETAVARAAEQTGALQAYGALSAADVEQRRGAKEMAAKLQSAQMASKQAYSMAYSQYMTDYANTSKSIFDSMNGNTPAAMQGANNATKLFAAGLGALGQGFVQPASQPAPATGQSAFASLPNEASLPIG